MNVLLWDVSGAEVTLESGPIQDIQYFLHVH